MLIKHIKPYTNRLFGIFFYLQKKDEVLVKFPPDEDAYTSVPCLMGTYSPMLFIRGYRFPENTEQIYVKKDIDGRSAGKKELYSLKVKAQDHDYVFEKSYEFGHAMSLI